MRKGQKLKEMEGSKKLNKKCTLDTCQSALNSMLQYERGLISMRLECENFLTIEMNKYWSRKSPK